MSHSRQLEESVPNQLNAIAKKIHDTNNDNPSLKVKLMLAAMLMRIATREINTLSHGYHNYQVQEYGEDYAQPADKLYLTEKMIISLALLAFFSASAMIALGDKALNRAAEAYTNTDIEKRLPTFDKALRFGLFYIAPKQPQQAENNHQLALAPQHN